jgi:hypothetical protein
MLEREREQRYVLGPVARSFLVHPLSTTRPSVKKGCHSAMCLSNTPPPTQSVPARSSRSPSPEKAALLRNSSCSLAPSVLFFGQSPSNGLSVRERESIRSPRPRLPSADTPAFRRVWRTDAPPRAPPALLIECGSLAWSLTRRERAPLTRRLSVALDRREAYIEGAGRASLLIMRRCCRASTIFLLRSSQ